MKRLVGWVLVMLGLSLSSTLVQAEVTLAAFEGVWEGTAVSENNTSVNFAITSRDMDVEIRPKTDKSFSITWRTLQRQEGQPGMPDEVLKETTRTYTPAKDKNIWHDTSKGNLLSGDTVSWAVLKGQKLTIYSMATNRKGGYDMLIYGRTLTGLGMKLDFKAIRDGQERRTAAGTLIKSGK